MITRVASLFVLPLPRWDDHRQWSRVFGTRRRRAIPGLSTGGRSVVGGPGAFADVRDEALGNQRIAG
ncbi:MAG: hypothetical protein ABWY12_10855, partial [Burkholderiales bacterium]